MENRVAYNKNVYRFWESSLLESLSWNMAKIKESHKILSVKKSALIIVGKNVGTKKVGSNKNRQKF